MNFAKLMASLKAAATATEEIVSITHPDSAEAVKVAAGFELFNVLATGIHAIMTAGDAPAAEPAPVLTTPETTAPNAA